MSFRMVIKELLTEGPRALAYWALRYLDLLYHSVPRLPLGWACHWYETTNIPNWPEMHDWPDGRLQMVFHRWYHK